MRIFHFLLLLSCSIPCTYSYAQENPASHETAAAAPTRSSLTEDDDPDPNVTPWVNSQATASPFFPEQEKNIDVDTYTGTLHVQIPLYELQTSGGNLPVTLNYTGTGVRLDDIHNSVGLGWDIAAGGKITRMIQGTIDRFSYLRETNDLSLWNKTFYDEKFYNTSDFDSRPDLYSFSLPGASGNFVLDSDARAHTFPYQPLDIQLDTLKNRFVIHDSQGTRYDFITYRDNYANHKKENDVARNNHITTSTWYLNEITYPNGSCVEFTYSTEEKQCISYYGTTEVMKIGNTLKQFDSPSASVDYEKTEDYHRGIPLTIRYKDQLIKFCYDYDGETYGNHYNQRINRIEIITNGNIYKTICFERDTFPNGNYRLRKVFEQARPGHKRPIASFAYFEEPVMPGHMHKGFDHWGYWNQDGDDLTGCPFVPIAGIYPEFGTSRASDLERTRAQSLKSITYPQGGSREIVYGLHVGRDRGQMMMRICGGLRVEKIIERDGLGSAPAEYRYTYDGGVVYADRFDYVQRIYHQSQYSESYSLSSHCLNAITDNNGSPVIYSTVSKYFPDGSCIKYEYEPLEEFDDLYPEKYLVEHDTVKFLGYEREENLPKTVQAWGRNLLKKKSLYDSDGKVVKSTEFQYIIDTAHAVRIAGLIPYRSQVDGHRVSCLARYFHICCPVLPKTRIEYAGKANLYCRTDYLYNRHHLPSHEIKRYADGTRVTSYTKYRCDLPDKIYIGSVKQRAPYLPVENVIYRNGKVASAALTFYREEPKRLYPASIFRIKEPLALIDSASFKNSYYLLQEGLKYDNRYTEAISFTDYDKEGTLTCYCENKKTQTSIVYQENRTMPLAYVINARYAPAATERVNEVWFDDFERDDFCSWVWPNLGPAKSGTRGRITTPLTIPVSNFKPGTYILSYWYLTNDSDRWFQHRSRITVTDTMDNYTVLFPAGAIAVDDVSLLPPNATLKSQVSIPGLGTISETDTRGRSLYHEYNGFGLPTRVLDNERQPLKTYSYDHYNANISIPVL